MVKIFPCRGEQVIPEDCEQGGTENRKQYYRGQKGVDEYLERMLVKRGQHFDTRSGMMHLVKQLPESLPMPKAVPPVKYKCADKPPDKTF